MRILSLKTRITLTIANTAVSLWLAMFVQMEWSDYVWQWSDNNAMLALQYLANGMWCIGALLLFIWDVIGIPFILSNGFIE